MDKAQFTTDALFIVNGALKLLEADTGVKFTLERYKIQEINLVDYFYFSSHEVLYRMLFVLKSASNNVYYLELPPSMVIRPELTVCVCCELSTAEKTELHNKITKCQDQTVLQTAIICEATWIYLACIAKKSKNLLWQWPEMLDR